MKIRTLDDLSKSLSDQLSWRKQELSELKNLIETSIPKHRKSVILRSGIAIIYAHWEGYLKIAGRNYLEYIASLRIENSLLTKNFQIISLHGNTNLFISSKKLSSYDLIVDFFENKQTVRAKIPYKEIIDTESNLSSKVLKEIIWCLNLDYSNFETKAKLIDERMLAKRNHIAHGEFLEVDDKDVISLRDEVLALMDEFKTQIENCALTKAYLR